MFSMTPAKCHGSPKPSEPDALQIPHPSLQITCSLSLSLSLSLSIYIYRYIYIYIDSILFCIYIYIDVDIDRHFYRSQVMFLAVDIWEQCWVLRPRVSRRCNEVDV